MADKIRAFVERLITRTEEGRINWERTVEDGVYQASFPSYTVHLFSRPSRSEDENHDYIVQLKDEYGTVIDEIWGGALWSGNRDRILSRMGNMFTLARRKALGVDKAVDAIMAELGEDPPPFAPVTDDDVPF